MANRQQPGSRGPAVQPRRQPPRRPPKRRVKWKLENPRRLATVLGILVILLIVICVIAIGGSDEEPKGPGVQTITPEGENAMGTQVPEASGRITGKEGIRNQLMGFFGSVILSNTENYPHDPENPEEELIEETVKPDYKYCVVLDASHGGEDLGNTYGEVYESPLMLDIVQEVRAAIQNMDPTIEVILTRESDTYMELADRARIANEAEADLFITVHCDIYTEDPSVSGISCQYWDSEETTERGQRSKEAAEKISADLAAALNLTDYGAWSEVMEVLYESEMPALALQFGYISCDTDRMILQDPSQRKPGVEALAASIVEIVNSYPESTEE